MNPAVDTNQFATRPHGIVRFAAVALLVVLAALTVRSAFASAPHRAPTAPSLAGIRATQWCAAFPNARFQFVVVHSSEPAHSVCGRDAMQAV
jgi:hypothetical protein